MTIPSEALIRASAVAARSMASRATPFIMNEWYVAAFASELGRTPLARKILGRDIVMFRTQSGAPVALDDRCAHRSLPLSRGTLDGDTLICGYHGFRFDTAGNCIQVPSQSQCPKGIGVANHTLVQRGPLVWIWMGDSASADVTRISQQPWLDEASWVRSQGYFDLQASYVSLHENLMDLTHLSYVHSKSFGTPDYAAAPYEMQLDEGHYQLTRRVVPTRLPPVWGQPTGLTGDHSARISTSEFVSPGLHIVSAQFYDANLPPGNRSEFAIKTAHIITPKSVGATHYFIVHGRDFALDRPDVTAFMHEQLFQAFGEDVDTLTAVDKVLAERGAEAYELSVASDAAGVAVRRYLKRRADEERASGAL